MRRRLAAAFLLTLAACAGGPPAQDIAVALTPERDGPPPAMGTVSLTEGGATQVFTTHDFSVGAFDGSAWFGPGDPGARLMMTACPDRNPDAETGLLRIEAQLPAPPVAGAVTGQVLVQVPGRAGSVPIRWSSLGRPAWLAVGSFARTGSDAFGQVTGRFGTTLCDMVAPKKNDCHEGTGTFDTEVQFDGI
jgi:hypothetical protein